MLTKKWDRCSDDPSGALTSFSLGEHMQYGDTQEIWVYPPIHTRVASSSQQCSMDLGWVMGGHREWKPR